MRYHIHAIIGAAAFLGAGLGAGQAMAEENWTPRLPGVGDGLAFGALPPPGVYFLNTTLMTAPKVYNNSGDKTDVRLGIFVDAPVLLWNPGVKVLGADYAVGVAQPFDYMNTAVGGASLPGDSTSHFGHFETVAIPGQFSWALPNDLHVSTGLSVYLPDGTQNQNGYNGVPNSINYWAFEPNVGLSWLHDGWNLSASLNFDINMRDQRTGYSSGNVLIGEYTATKTVGKWTMGLTGFTDNQIEADQSNNAAAQANINLEGGNKQTRYSLGPLVGYNFGPLDLTAYVTQDFGVKNGPGGTNLWTRVSVPF